MTELPHGEHKATVVRTMFDAIAARYDLVNRVMTLGLDMRWRRSAVRALGLPGSSLVLDLACGTGDLCRELEAAGMRAVGVDFSSGMLAAARTSAPLVQGDVLALPVCDGIADGITCGFALRNVVDLDRLFAECARILRPGGRLVALELSEPRSPLLRFGHRIYFHHVVPLIGAVLSDRSAYRYLPESVAYLPTTESLLRVLRSAGFADASSRPLALGAAQLFTATRR